MGARVSANARNKRTHSFHNNQQKQLFFLFYFIIFFLNFISLLYSLIRVCVCLKKSNFCSSCADYRLKYVSSFITVIFGTTNYGQSLSLSLSIFTPFVYMQPGVKPILHPDIKMNECVNEIHITK